ncbi:MAG: sugar phosphate isomerase [Lachnospiraceae bacterium]|nr:sugar phosphate isomerase [Lachnospiraceae bacterium]
MSDIKACVSLYSLQDEYLNKRMSLSDIMHFVKEQGAEGVEILPDQMIKGSPYASDEEIANWNKLVEETGLTPVIADVFLNTNLYKNRTLTKKECIDLLTAEIIQAHKMGIHLIRLVSMVPYWVLEPLMPVCEEYDVALAIEVHAAMAFDVQATKEFLDEVKRLDSKYAGIVIDTGIFCRRFPRVVRAYETNNGTSPQVFDYIDTLFEKGTDLHAVLLENHFQYPPELEAACQSEHDKMFVPLCDGYENLPFEVLDEYMPYIYHFHFKLFEMTEEGPEYSMDYKALLEYLHEHDYHGYVSTEYEGNRFTLPGTPMQEKKQVAMQQAYIQKCLKEIYG